MSIKTQNFQPSQFLTFAAGAGSSAAAQTITQTLGDATNSSPLYDVRIFNASNGIAFVSWGGTSVIATTTTGIPVGAGLSEKFNMGQPARGVAVILGTGTGNVYVSPGAGA